MKNLLTKQRVLLLLILIFSLGNNTYSQENRKNEGRLQKGQKAADKPFQLRKEFSIKGNLTFIANNTLNRDGVGTGSAAANNAFDGKGKNDDNGNKYMEYIDIDTDPTTFSSSSATLNLPSCSKVIYAGLYWAAIYPYQNWNEQKYYGESAPNTRDNDFNNMKFKLPGAANYTDITGEVVYDEGISSEKPYVCYKDVTNLVQGLSNPNGVYYGANIKATRGKDSWGHVSLGSSAGWVLVVVYENATETRKKFFVFDGFTTIKRQPDGSAGVYDVPFSGFNTIPTGQVGANFLLGALEGDINIDGDSFQLEDTSGNFQPLNTTNLNDTDNFFNSTITINDNYLGGRYPDSENTLGFDIDFFELNNPGNTLLGNNQTNGVLRFSSEGDTYWPFLLGLSVEVIEPDILLVKKVDDGNGNDIGGSEVDLGDILWYDISFKNKGNDDATNTVLIDRLPKNVDLLDTELIVPDGVTYTYEPPSLANDFRGLLRFQIPDGLVESGDPEYHIRLKVKVVENCYELRDACSNKIENQALISYKGKTTDVVVNEDPSFYAVNECNFGFSGASNFLADIDGCVYEREETLCASSIELSAGNGFLSYTWKNSKGEIIGTTQTITVTETGKYTVDKVAPVGCISSQEIVNVVKFAFQDNPILDYADEVKICPNDGTKLSEIYLCGDGSSRVIKTNIFNSDKILWQKLDENSCTVSADTDCPTTDNTCTWNTIKEGNDFDATTPGQYRLEIRSQGGCFKRYYFNVFKATLNPEVTSTDIICGTPGSITINNIPNGYEFSLTNTSGSYQSSNTFSITTPGKYNLYIRRKGAAATACVYTLPQITIAEKKIEVELITEPILCSDSKGAIRVQVNNITGDYTYKLFKGENLLATTGPKADNDHSFEVSEAGVYTVEVTAPNSCSFSGQVTFTKPDPLNFTATTTKDITCTYGIIELSTTGGTPIYNYAIWSFNGTDLYTSVSDIPYSSFFTSNLVNIAEDKAGTYEFIVMDGNNCWIISNPVTVNVAPKIAFKDTIQHVSCHGQANGSFEISVDGSALGYLLEYSIDNGANYQTSGSFTNLSAGTYTVKINATKGTDVCTYQRTITISEPDSITGNASITQQYTCTTPGEITFDTPTGGTAPYQFSIDGANYFSTKVFTNLKEGTYQPSIKDANNCILVLPSLTIDALPVAPNVTPTVTYNCDGTGNIEVSPTNSAYTFSLDGGAFSASSTFNNVSVGSHTIRINYGKNCVKTIVVDVEANKAFTGTISNLANVVCNGSSNGTMTITTQNSGGSFEYSLNGASWIVVTGNAISLINLPTGNYAVRIKSNSCIVDLGTQIITEPADITVSASITNQISCTNTGATITPSATGGTAPYQFSIDNGVSWTNQFTNVQPGSYTVTAKDANNCLATTNAVIQINAPIALKHTATSTECYSGTNGQIEVTVSQGNGNYMFSINNGPWQTPNVATPNKFTFTNLTPNSYTVKVKDALGCESTVSNHTIYPQLSAVVISDNISCNDGKITVNATGGDGNYVYAFVAKGVVVSNTDFSTASTKSITTVGDYDVYVRDRSGSASYCEFVTTVSIAKTPELQVATTPTQPKCFGDSGAIQVSLSGGLTPYKIAISGPAGYAATTTNFYGTTKDFYNLAAGTYTITVTGNDGCFKTITETITAAKELKATTNPIIPACGVTDPSLFGFEFVVTENYAPYTIEYSADNGATWSTNSTFMNIVSGTKVNPVIRLLETDGTTVRCVKALDPLTIPFHVSNLVVSTQAAGSCADGFKVTVKAQDGVAPYQFAINSTSTWVSPTPANAAEHVFDKLTPGLNYTFYVKDANGCIKENSVNIYDTFTPDVLITGNVTNNACATSDNGAIEFTIDDSKNPLTGTINWNLYNKNTNTVVRNGSQTNTNTIVVSNLPAGDYYMTITNGVSCSWGSADVSITKGTAINALAVASKDITCDQPGVIEIKNIYGGFGNYQFTLTSTNFVSPIVSSNYAIEIPISNLKNPTIASTVSIKVKDQSSCDKDLANVVLNVSEKPAIKSVVANSCDINKTITITAEKGQAPYFYSIDGGTSYHSNSIFENLTAGNYTVKIKDSNGCESDPEAVTLAPTLDFNAQIIKNLDCSVAPNAAVQINVTSGSGNYDFEIKDSANNTVYARAKLTPNPLTVSFSKSDTYAITVFDNDASVSVCSKTVQVEIPKTLLPEFTYTVENSTCAGSNSGVISLTNSNPSLSYTYSISPSSGSFDVASNSFTNLAPGTYQITATGSNGCTVVKPTITISEFNPIVVPTPTVTEFGCVSDNTVNNATITVDVSKITGGSGSYARIEFVDNKGTTTKADDVIVQKGNSPTYSTNDTNGGNFTIYVYDTKECIGVTNAVINPYPALLSASITVDKKIDCATGENITVSYTSTLPIANANYTIVGQKGFTANNTTGTFTNLSEDIYTITVENVATGCEVQTIHQVANPNQYELQVTKQTDASCFGSNTGTVTLDFSTTTPYTDLYNYEVYNNQTGTATSIKGTATSATTITGLAKGGYYVRVTMPNTPFCSVTSEVFTIENPIQPLDFTATVTPINCTTENSGKLGIAAQGGWGNYQYQVTTLAGAVVQAYNSNYNLENLTADTYVISVKDKNGCELSKNVSLTSPQPITATVVETTPIVCAGDAGATITVNATSGGQGTPPTYWYQLQKSGQAISAKQTGNTFTGLSAGDYTVIISDGYACSTSLPISIKEPTKVTATAAIKSNVSCLVGTANVEVTASGGTAGYTYSSDGVNFTASNKFAVTAGTHQFYVKDANGCISDASAIITINKIPTLTATLDVTSSLISCSSEQTAVLKTLASGGLGDYKYELLDASNKTVRPQQVSSEFKNLGAGTYKVKVTSKDCEVITAPQTIVEPTPLVLNAPITVTNISCFGAANGSITINASGGTGNLVYSIDQLKFVATNAFNNLAAGTYEVVIQDERGCFITETVTITEPSELKATAINIKEETCFGSNNASFEIQITGGTGPYKTKLNGGDFVQDQFVFNNLTGGKTYAVFIADSKGCETVVTIPLKEAVVLNFLTSTSVNCATSLSTIDATVDAAYAKEVTYAINGGSEQTSGKFENLADGTYTIKVRHINGCEITKDVTITNPAPLVFNAPAQVTNVLCNGANNGTLTVNAKGGSGTLLYSIDGVNFQKENTFSNLSPKEYTITVKDNLTCAITEKVTVTEPSAINVVVENVQDETCVGTQNGAFDLKIAGGTGNYQTKLEGQNYTQGKTSFNNLEGGKTYKVYVKDANNCETSIDVAIKDGVALNVNTSTTVNCTTYLSTIDATVDAAFAKEVTYAINGGSAQASGKFENLADGTYTIKVTHINGCEITKDVTITNPEPLVFNAPAQVTNVLCNGANNGTIKINAKGGRGDLLCSIDGVNYKRQSEFTNLAPGTYKVHVKDQLSCAPITETVVITEPQALQVNVVNIKQATCVDMANASFELQINGDVAPYQTKLEGQDYVQGQFSFMNLEGGKTYKVYVKGNNGCEKIIDVPLEAAVNLELNITASRSCSDGSTIIATVNQAYTNEVMYSINETDFQKEPVFSKLSAGKYTVTAKHNNGCTTSKQIEIDFIEPLELSVDTSTTNKLIVTASGGVGPYTYSVDDGPFTSNNEFIISVTKSYKITVRDALGCEVVELVDGEFISIIIPNFFTPNGNGENDYWYPERVQEYHDIKVQVYDRYSRLLKTFKGIQQGWDGVYNNVPLPSGDYWYVIHYTEILGERKKLMGNFTLYR
ncbi:MAG: T9SS type B sorting domain-containing protein [Flavobacteriaceae bacterium]|nr:T9SS type B sorting domain-containing protein [Flavobacteriaceae bacterium]